MTRAERISVVKREIELLEHGSLARMGTSYEAAWKTQIQFKKIELLALEETQSGEESKDGS